jgi:hypothetical protein
MDSSSPTVTAGHIARAHDRDKTGNRPARREFEQKTSQPSFLIAAKFFDVLCSFVGNSIAARLPWRVFGRAGRDPCTKSGRFGGFLNGLALHRDPIAQGVAVAPEPTENTG